MTSESSKTSKDIKQNATILDACCGGRMFWYDKSREDTIYMDIREVDPIDLWHGRMFQVQPDVVADFRDMPFPDGRFKLVIFDPPHLTKGDGWMQKKYGTLGPDWKNDIRQGFKECMRVLEPEGILIFKWSEYDIKLREIAPLFPCRPLIGQRRLHGSPIWIVFKKETKSLASNDTMEEL